MSIGEFLRTIWYGDSQLRMRQLEDKANTVGALRDLLSHSEDEEPLSLMHNSRNRRMKCVGAQSAAGGRATILWFEDL